jgi:hypothetical protein
MVKSGALATLEQIDPTDRKTKTSSFGLVICELGNDGRILDRGRHRGADEGGLDREA